MITNSSLTVYHKDGLDVATHFEKWTRYNYDKVWFFGGKGAGINKGYDNANDVEIRLPYDSNANLDISNFAIGDIIVKGALDIDPRNQVVGLADDASTLVKPIFNATYDLNINTVFDDYA